MYKVKTGTQKNIQVQSTELTRISLTPGIFARSGKSDSNQLCIDEDILQVKAVEQKHYRYMPTVGLSGSYLAC